MALTREGERDLNRKSPRRVIVFPSETGTSFSCKDEQEVCMKVKNYIITGIITFIILLFLGWSLTVSVWGMQQEPNAPNWLKAGYIGMMILIILPVMIMMIVTAVKRKQEIDEEDEDDLSQY